MPYVIKNHRTDQIVSPKFKTWKDADRYQHKNIDLKNDPQRHYFIIDTVGVPKKNRSKVASKKNSTNKSKLKMA